MTEQTKELVAIGAAVAAHCQPCLKFHYAKARELGVEVTDINAAIDVGHQVSRGAGKAIRDFQENLVINLSGEPGDGGCCDDKAGGSSEGKCC